MNQARGLFGSAAAEALQLVLGTLKVVVPSNLGLEERTRLRLKPIHERLDMGIRRITREPLMRLNFRKRRRHISPRTAARWRDQPTITRPFL
ncbi:MAG: hypothetical protein ACRD88_01420 [Terriglobia bacterium]